MEVRGSTAWAARPPQRTLLANIWQWTDYVALHGAIYIFSVVYPLLSFYLNLKVLDYCNLHFFFLKVVSFKVTVP